MSFLNKILSTRRTAKRKTAFARAMIEYFWDIAHNDGKRSQWLYADILQRATYYNETAKWDTLAGTYDALDIIKRYRLWEGQSWKKPG